MASSSGMNVIRDVVSQETELFITTAVRTSTLRKQFTFLQLLFAVLVRNYVMTSLVLTKVAYIY
jgi:hypothetical protein